MNKKILFFSIISIAFFLLSSCGDDDKDEIQPGNISNIRAEKRDGGIMLRWDVPSDSNYHYVEVSFEDPWRNKKRVRLSSVYTDSVAIWGLLERFGDYKFTLQTYSTTFTPGKAETFSAISGYRQASYTSGADTPITLAEKNLSTNAQEPSEGPIKNLLDEDASTYFHTAWSVSKTPPHYLQVDLDNPITQGGFKFKYRTRSSGSGCPQTIDVAVSEDGTNFVDIATLTADNDDLPVGKSVEFTSKAFNLYELLPEESYFEPKHIRLSVKKTNSGEMSWFCLSDFWFWESKIVVFDPENDLEAQPDEYDY